MITLVSSSKHHLSKDMQHSVFLTFSFRILQNCCKKHQRPFQTNFNEPYKNSFAFSQIEATASLGNLSDIPFLPNRRDLPARPQLLCSQSNYDSQSSGTKGFWEKKPFLEIVNRVLQKGKFCKCQNMGMFFLHIISSFTSVFMHFQVIKIFQGNNKNQKLKSSDCFKQIYYVTQGCQNVKNIKSFRLVLLQCFWPIESESARKKLTLGTFEIQ